MQEDIENRSVTLIISTAKLTGRVLKAALTKYLAQVKEKKAAKARAGPVIPQGKQTVKQLVGQNAGVSNIEVNDSNIKSFERVARKYGVDFAVKRDRSVSPPKYLVFFKARDADALTAAFTEFTAKTVNRVKKPSALAQLRKFTELVKNSVIDRVKHREQERSI
ncbi:MAG: PcfB family protein [Ethanoligenens sp.]